ncbi:MAG: hypothetical protein PWP08_781 [Methanofollis sp.]|nr:hypothetical protein [Methanofollis sp.]
MTMTKFALVCLLLLGCVLPVSAVPALPLEVYGTVTCGGAPAPAGTVVVALIDGAVCGQITLDEDGVMGGVDTFDERLIVTGTEEGSTVVFTVNGEAAAETLTFSPGTVARLDLTAPASALDPTRTHAAFAAAPTSGAAPLTVRFTDLSTNATTWSWTFGDGGTATGQHPSHTYAAAGNYTVALAVNGGVDTVTKIISVLPVLFGDANNDGAVDQADTLRVLREVVGLATKPASGTDLFMQTDVHNNGAVEIGDAMFIAQRNVGLRGPWFGPVGSG